MYWAPLYWRELEFKRLPGEGRGDGGHSLPQTMTVRTFQPTNMVQGTEQSGLAQTPVLGKLWFQVSHLRTGAEYVPVIMQQCHEHIRLPQTLCSGKQRDNVPNGVEDILGLMLAPAQILFR